MRESVVLAFALTGAMAASFMNGCGSTGSNEGGPARIANVDASGPSFMSGSSDGGDDGGGVGHSLSSVHIVPANAKVTVKAGQSGSQPYTVMGVVDGALPEVDVTSRFVFYVPDNYLVGGFPANGGPLFTTRLPSVATDPPQRGGLLTVQAQAMNPGGQLVTTTTALTVELDAEIDGTGSVDGGVPDGGAVPANASTLFASGPVDATRAPVLEYPNDGTMLPPNLRLLDVHWMPGSASNTLYRIAFTSPTAQITYYSRCGTLDGLLTAGACGFQLDEAGYAYLSQSNAGVGNVQLTISGTDDTGTGVGTSQSFNIQFAQQPVNGGVYYWDVSDTRIMRFDFGGTSSVPEVFLQPGNYGTGGTCIGCHALSRDGTKLAASAGGQNTTATSCTSMASPPRRPRLP